LYKIFIFPNYLEDKSLIILINNHSITDGMGSNIIFAKMLDTPSEDMMPPFKAFSYWTLIEKYFLVFYYVPLFMR